MKMKCEKCGKKVNGLPKKYNKFDMDLCFDCFGDVINLIKKESVK